MLAPAILSLTIFEMLTKGRTIWFRIQYFCIGSMAINGVVFGALSLLYGTNFSFCFSYQAPAALLKFIIMYGAVAIVVALCLVAFTNLLEVKVEKKQHEKV